MNYQSAVDKYLESKMGLGLSSKTRKRYEKQLGYFTYWGRDPEIENVGTNDIELFVNYLQGIDFPINGDPKSKMLTAKQIYDIKVASRGFWNWASRQYNLINPFGEIEIERPESEKCRPFSERDVHMIFKVLGFSSWRDPDFSELEKLDELGLRNLCLILILFDTGISQSEISRIRFRDVKVFSNEISIVSKVKQRTVYFSNVTKEVMKRYYTILGNAVKVNPPFPLFQSAKTGKPILKKEIINLYGRISIFGGIDCVSISRFRDTFAVNFLMNDGKSEDLAQLLGVSLNKVERYAQPLMDNYRNKYRNQFWKGIDYE